LEQMLHENLLVLRLYLAELSQLRVCEAMLPGGYNLPAVG